MAYGKAPEEVPHVRIEVRMEEGRGLQGRIQRWESACRQRPGRHERPRGGRGRPQAGNMGLPGVRLRAHVRRVGVGTISVKKRAPAGDVTSPAGLEQARACPGIVG